MWKKPVGLGAKRTRTLDMGVTGLRLVIRAKDKQEPAYGRCQSPTRGPGRPRRALRERGRQRWVQVRVLRKRRELPANRADPARGRAASADLPLGGDPRRRARGPARAP